MSTSMLDITGSSVGDLFESIVGKGLEVWKSIEESDALTERLGLELQLRQLEDNRRAEEVSQPVYAPGVTDGGSTMIAGVPLGTIAIIAGAGLVAWLVLGK
ncbi:hypothetical protein [Pyruvatibacter mobilis]|uniref:hypothetical protein n=1 Tax=Pyruvatibacter mobilis TaxID=1712261 RepID=UPI003BAC02BB